MQGPATHDEQQLLARLREGDEAAFAMLVDAWSPAMLRVARAHVPSGAVAEEVVQETWLGVLRGLDGFEGRSSLRTWAFQILVNRAHTRGEREHRTVPFAALATREVGDGDEAIPPDRFLGADHDRWPHHWATPPRRWDESPERSAESAETLDVLRAAISRLPPMQRLVITMRDVEGWPAHEVCEVLGITDGNQRILLHRARTTARAVLEAHLAP